MLNQDTGIWQYEPNTDYHGNDSFTIRATDANGGTSDHQYNLTVEEGNDPTAITSGLRGTTSQGSESQPGQLRTTLEVTDADGLTGNNGVIETITIVDNGQPSHGVVALGDIQRNSNNTQAASVSWTYTPTKADFYGGDMFTVEITDDKNMKITKK